MITWFSSKKKNTSSVNSQEKDTFVSLSSHQLRSPLSIIKWYTEILLDEDAGPLTDDQKKYLTVIENSNQRAIDLVRSLLNVSRLDLGTFRIDPTPVDISQVIQEVLHTLEKDLSAKKITVTRECEETLPVINADSHIITLVLKNLLANAIAFSELDGAITVTSKIVKKGEMTGKEKISSDAILVEVTDTGIGVPEKDTQELFSKMFRASNVQDSNGSGSGLGLYITKTVVDIFGGQIWFTTSVGKGSTFFVTFPLKGMKKKEGRTTLD